MDVSGTRRAANGVTSKSAPRRLFDAAGELQEWVGACTDVHEQRKAQEVLRRSEEELRALANSIPQLAWMAEAGRPHLLVQSPLVRIHRHDSGADAGLGLAVGA